MYIYISSYHRYFVLIFIDSRKKKYGRQSRGSWYLKKFIYCEVGHARAAQVISTLQSSAFRVNMLINPSHNTCTPSLVIRSITYYYYQGRDPGFTFLINIQKTVNKLLLSHSAILFCHHNIKKKLVTLRFYCRRRETRGARCSLLLSGYCIVDNSKIALERGRERVVEQVKLKLETLAEWGSGDSEGQESVTNCCWACRKNEINSQWKSCLWSSASFAPCAKLERLLPSDVMAILFEFSFLF